MMQSHPIAEHSNDARAMRFVRAPCGGGNCSVTDAI